MKVTLRLHDETVRWVVCHLCSRNGVGDYEGFPDRKMHLPLPGLAEKLAARGYAIDGVNDKICLANQCELQLTIYASGSIIVEGVVPDTYDQALVIMLGVLEGQQL